MRSPPRTFLMPNWERGQIEPSISTAMRDISNPNDSTTSFTLEPSLHGVSAPLTIRVRTDLSEVISVRNDGARLSLRMFQTFGVR